MINSIKTGVFLFVIFFLLSACTDKNGPGEETSDGLDSLISVNEEKSKTPEFALKLVEEKDPSGYFYKYHVIKNTGQRHGHYQKLNEEGQLLEEADYMIGALNGKRILYYPSQDTQIVETHENGIFQGPYRSFYPGNKLRLKGDYIDNQMQGIWKMYYDTGELKEEVTFENNMENGPFVEYHKNGQISVTGNYKNGDNEDGTLKFFTEEGVHYKTMECNEGLCRTTWKLDETQ